jgi:hypothetical protein
VDVVLMAVAWTFVGLVLGVLATRAVYRRSLITAGRFARAPVCNSCPFVSEEQRKEIYQGRPSEVPPTLPLPMLDGSGLHRPA